METAPPWVIPLRTADASLQLAGGKASALARLASKGFAVPDGFIVTTAAYRDFTAGANLFAPQDAPSLDQIQELSLALQSRFEEEELPSELEAEFHQAYQDLGSNVPVAVRSSATAEDLPDASFAGQQETFLHIRGIEALCKAVRHCWASLWSIRAMTYRSERNFHSDQLAIAVLVQRMVEAETSGVAFTANPHDGSRDELVITASYGLGESVVSGTVNPDTIIIDRATGSPKDSQVGSKATKIISSEPSSSRSLMTTQEVQVEQEQQDRLCLTSSQINEIVKACESIETEMNSVPQDIEFALSKEQLWILQSRPITNLPEPTQQFAWEPHKKGERYVRRQVVENMPGPLSPLFEELYLTDGFDASLDAFLERYAIPMRMDDMVDRPFFLTVNGYAYCRAHYRFRWRMLWSIPRLCIWYLFSMRKMIKNAPDDWKKGLDEYQETIAQHQTDSSQLSSEELLSSIRQLATADAIYWLCVAVVLGVAKITDGMLHRFLTSRLVRGKRTSGEFLRGFPSRTATGQHELEVIAQLVGSNPELKRLVIDTPAVYLPHRLNADVSAAQVRESINEYLEQYGHQFYNLDFAEPTQSEDPQSILISLKTLVRRSDYDFEERRKLLTAEREELEKEVSKSLGPVRRWIFRKLLRWAQKAGPYREDAMFYVGLAWPLLRQHALELGSRLVTAQALKEPEEIFFLQSNEIEAIIGNDESRQELDYREVVAERRKLQENRKRLHPPPMVPIGSKLKFGFLDLTVFETQKRNAADAQQLDGFAVSPGSVTGVASVVISPEQFSEMKPDTILVCPTTTPAWTPLFTQAIGLVTDIGGILAHGSIVAREYGIPAVLGTGNATQRITTGQRITVDGHQGTVTIHDGSEAE